MADLFVCRIEWEDGTVEETRPLSRLDAERHASKAWLVPQSRRPTRYELVPTPQIPLFDLAR